MAALSGLLADDQHVLDAEVLAAAGVNSGITGTTALTSISNAGDITIESTGAGVNVNLHSDAGDDFAVDTDKLVVEGDTGKVGIGTAAPAGQLNIRRSDTSEIAQLRLDQSSTGDTSMLFAITGLILYRVRWVHPHRSQMFRPTLYAARPFC